MKKFALIAICAAMLTACSKDKKTQNASVNTSNVEDSLTNILSQKDQELNDIMSTFNDIQQGLNEITAAQGRVTVEKSNAENPANRQAILEDLKFIQTRLSQNRTEIARLKQRLKNSSFRSTKIASTLQTTIDNLTAELDQKNKQIEALRDELAAKNIVISQQGKQIDDLNTNVNTLTESNNQKQRVVEAQDKTLNTAYFVFGTKSELKEQKILQRGDVLRGNNFNKDYFTKIDIRTDREIKLYSKRAKLLTSHPAGSYNLSKDSKGQYILYISNPTSFWSVSKYLVILVK